jgi:hypothetical protein
MEYEKICYNITEVSPMNEHNKTLINRLKDKEEEFKKCKKKNKKLVDFFINLLYPYKKDRNYEKEFKSKKYNLNSDTFDHLKDMVAFPQQRMNDNSFYLLEKSEWSIIDITNNDLFTTMIYKAIQHLNTIIKFTEYYPDLKTITKNKHIWKYYNQFKV